MRNFDLGVPIDLLNLQFSESTDQNTCFYCRKVTASLFFHYLKDQPEEDENICPQRICENCFNENENKECTNDDCKVTFDENLQQHRESEHHHGLIFQCPLEEPCSQLLTFEFFSQHNHDGFSRTQKEAFKRRSINNRIAKSKTSINVKRGKMVEIESSILEGIRQLKCLTNEVNEEQAELASIDPNFEPELHTMPTFDEKALQAFLGEEIFCSFCGGAGVWENQHDAFSCGHKVCKNCLTKFLEENCSTCKNPYLTYN
ncbi:Oidioi.mRNA.OKI2018_I69.chr1.g710.t1.cds [Oikopleura dioica]|uniref:Oidioi.mRNA.OKI2018_I69.chr1.g710.t1.cds n=1 Tax=Oikopleura dioica TaxID=34765 RepID=A0ABN7SUX8_OIKDI|nr:Oidioi.mRNA.OKI2018_I69.chr1.g710.t1.cds [Oikopleura dioica]